MCIVMLIKITNFFLALILYSLDQSIAINAYAM